MTTQRILTYAIGFLVLLGALAAANVYLIDPALQPELPTVQPLPPAPSVSTAVDRNIVGATLQKIKAVPTTAEPMGFEPRQVERNPFLWPGEEPAKPEMTAEERALAEAPPTPAEELEMKAVVHMILIAENKRIAVIDDQLVQEGDHFQDHRVSSIQKDKVILMGDYGEVQLGLGQMKLDEAFPRKRLQPAAAMEAQAPQTPEGMPMAGPTQAQQEAVMRLMERLAPLVGPMTNTPNTQ